MPLPKIPGDMEVATVSFYSQKLRLNVLQPEPLAEIRLQSDDEASVSQMWQQLAKSNASACIDRLLMQQRQLNLNDWAMYDVTSKLASQMFSDDSRRVVTTVFLLNQMEYDAKIARTDNGLACLLALDCMVYATPFVLVDNIRYFIFLPDGSQKDYNGKIYTYDCAMEGARLSIGMALDQTPVLPVKKSARVYRHTVQGFSVEMAVNENLMAFYSHYPQVEMNIYANADVDSLFLCSVKRCFQPMVQGKSAYDAVATLLHYMHFGFDYATDDDQFGYEKPFFCEENFYYPRNDCEDRSILFSRLVRNLLGLDVVLLDYPNHIATAVCFPEGNVNGDYYEVDGRKYVVCDPTYIGADIGMAQPAYKTVKADIIRLAP